jgi:hypothetical protein
MCDWNGTESIDDAEMKAKGNAESFGCGGVLFGLECSFEM